MCVLPSSLRSVVPRGGWLLSVVGPRPHPTVRGLDTSLPTAPSRTMRQWNSLHMHHANASRSGNIKHLHDQQRLIHAVRSALKRQRCARDAVPFGHDDRQKIRRGAHSGLHGSTPWRCAVVLEVRLLGRMTQRIGSGASSVNTATPPFGSAKLKIPRGEWNSMRCVKRSVLRYSPQPGARS